jgi:hypothetical protein
MGYLLKRLNAMHIDVQIDQAAKQFLAEKGYDEKYGARPLRRTIQRYVEDELAELVLRGQVGEGGAVKIGFDEENKKLTYKATLAPPTLTEGESKDAPQLENGEETEPVEEAPSDKGGKASSKRTSKTAKDKDNKSNGSDEAE